MCGLAGVILEPRTRKPEHWQHLKEAFEILFHANESRGMQASGIVVVDNTSKFNHIKANIKASELIKTSEYASVIKSINPKTTMVMAHTRMPTHGTTLDYHNNHPIRIGSVIGSHNGIVTNADEVYKRHNFDRLGEVDSEILCRFAENSIDSKTGKLNHDDFYEGLKELSGNIVFTFMNLREPTIIHLVKPNSPLEVQYSSELGAYLWTSEYRHMTDALKGKTQLWSTLTTTIGHHYYVNTNKIDTYYEIPIKTLYRSAYKNKTHYLPQHSAIPTNGKHGSFNKKHIEDIRKQFREAKEARDRIKINDKRGISNG